MAIVAIVAGASGCAGRHRGPRTLAGVGAVLGTAGGASWAIGERRGQPESAMVSVGFVGVALGIAAMIASGAMMAASIGCNADPDCHELEQCKEIPAPPGGVPYKQCVPR